MQRTLEVGDIMGYPCEQGHNKDDLEKGWRRVCRISENAARFWAESVGVDLEADEVRYNWHNKNALVVDEGENERGQAVALYPHDFTWWVIVRDI